MYISLRQKIAGKAEAKKVTGLNFEEVRSKLISEGIEPTTEEIKSRLLDESNLVISNNQKDLILNTNLSEGARKRVNDIESALIIIGAVFDGNNVNGIIETFNWYLETMELKPGDLGINQQNISNISAIKESFEKLYNKVSEEKRASDEKAASSKGDSYLSNEVVYDFGDGWKVVYVPAAGEMESFPGLSETSHDRILEGNKNGLCLGSGSRYYQNNNSGKIYSIRDPENKPRVTIRIDENILKEAKGKNNNSPDVESAEKADAWFKTIKNLSYKNNGDYIAFPPLNIKDARKSFLENKDKAYSNGWAPHWYGKGIRELDEDIERKISENDPSLITGGFGKHPAFFEKIKPVVIYWCNQYNLNENYKAKEIMFGKKFEPPTHEVFKTYKKLKEMDLAIETLSRSENDVIRFFELELYKIKEYEKYIPSSVLLFSKKFPFDFIKFYKEKKESWAEPYLDATINIFSKLDPFEFLKNFSGMPESKNYIDDAARKFSYEDPKRFLELFYNKEWAKEYIHNCATRIIDEGAFEFLEKSSRNNYNFIFPWAKQYLDDVAITAIKEDANQFLFIFADNRGYYYNSDYDWYEKHIDFAVKSFFEQRSELDFIFLYNRREWAKKYLDDAARIAANKVPQHFLLDVGLKAKSSLYKEEWVKKYIDLAARESIKLAPNKFINWFSEEDWAQPYLDLAAKTCAELYPFIFISRKITEEPFSEKYGKYINLAITSSLEKDPDKFISKFSEEPWAEQYLDLARKKIEDKKNKTAKNKINKKLLKLSKILNSIGIYENINF
jgi:hypothetical protein